MLNGWPFQVSAQARESTDDLKDLATASYAKTLGTILISVYESASNRSAYVTGVISLSLEKSQPI